MRVKELPITEVKIGERFRKDLGDLERLAEGIRDHGLFQPIGITAENELVFGQRRLVAARDILKWEKVPCVVVEPQSKVEGQFEENDNRKELMVSERVRIAQAVEAEIGNRRGQRTDLGVEEEPRRPGGEVASGERTDDLAAQKAGFTSGDTYRRAKKVVDHGSAALVKALDEGKIKPRPAAKVADLPKKQQAEIVKAILVGDRESLKKAVGGNGKARKAPYNEFFKAVKELSQRMDSIVEQYGSLSKMFDSDQWDGDPVQVADLIHEVCLQFQGIDQEGQKYVQRHCKTE